MKHRVTFEFVLYDMKFLEFFESKSVHKMINFFRFWYSIQNKPIVFHKRNIQIMVKFSQYIQNQIMLKQRPS